MLNRSRLTVNTLLSWLVLLGLWGSIIMPSLSVGGMSLYLTTLISPVVLIFVAYFSFMQGKLPVDILVLVVLSLCIVVVFSALFSWIKGLTMISYRDLIEAVKYAQYIPYLLALPFLKNNFEKTFKLSSKLSVTFFLILGFLQVFGIHFFTYIYLGSGSEHLDSALSGHRLSLTGSDPNIGGAIAAFFAFVSLTFFLFQRKSVFWFGAFLLCFILLLFTQSRSVLVAFVFSLMTFFVFYYKVALIIKVSALMICISIGGFLFMSLDIEYIIIGFQTALEGKNQSLNVRLENIVSAYEVFKVNPIIGVGPSKESLSTIIDSEYALIMQRYGLAGMLLFTLLIGFLLKAALKNKEKLQAKILLLFMMMVPFIMLANNVFSGYQLMSIPVLLYMVSKSQRKLYA